MDQGAPKGKADFAGLLWRELFKHACSEAHRLGLEINMNNDAGWCGSGGPWITPELSMQIVVWTETVVEGGKPFEGALAKPGSLKTLCLFNRLPPDPRRVLVLPDFKFISRCDLTMKTLPLGRLVLLCVVPRCCG